MVSTTFPQPEKRSTLLYGTVALSLCLLIGLGVFAKNGWFPHTDPLSGKKTGWFGNPVSVPPAVAGGLREKSQTGWFSSPPPSPTPQLAKEYIYAGSRLLAVEDANANAAPPADLAVWRPSTGVWWVMGGQGSQQVTQAWGSNGDTPVPGDYDGDGKTDFSVFRPSNGTWYIVNSSTGGTGQFPFGATGDKPAPADYDGDGKTDAAVFRPSNGNWYILQSSNGVTTQGQFGLSTDEPAPADYDGDGRADIGVWRASNSMFYSLRSTDTVLQTADLSNSVTPGNSATPVSADYDGDGKADYAVHDSSSASWIIRSSVTSATTVTVWQLASDLPVQNDYDGDGKVDLATWRNSNGNWYIRQSASGNSLRQVQWGIPGDIPVPAFYRR